jgi:hypothetical protein
VELLLSMQAKMDANQERMETNRKAYHEEMKAMVDAYHERKDGGRYREDRT